MDKKKELQRNIEDSRKRINDLEEMKKRMGMRRTKIVMEEEGETIEARISSISVMKAIENDLKLLNEILEDDKKELENLK